MNAGEQLVPGDDRSSVTSTCVHTYRIAVVVRFHRKSCHLESDTWPIVVCEQRGVAPASTQTSDTDGKGDSILQVRYVDLHVAENAEQHRTDEFQLTKGTDPVLVVRRGDPFRLTIDLSRHFNPDRDTLAFVFTVKGENYSRTESSKLLVHANSLSFAGEEAPSYTKNTVAVVPVGYRSSTEYLGGVSSWTAFVKTARDDVIDVEDMVWNKGWHQTTSKSSSRLDQGRTDVVDLGPDLSFRADYKYTQEPQLSTPVHANEHQSRRK
ncbi:hypothetical protein HPB51_023951 [Rhipicephalus microplus]|uniref:Transglutaminase N-terminal domain-containing protein n=1 Tax=Rhipicephalus microplus TaxID=6941 RepID=A0A9J6DD25_RHIMP|nr:hypothetical protein HPB51_023951 [Rhipicephalus microplus]